METPNREMPKEDMTEILAVAEKIADHTNRFQAETVEQAGKIEGRVLVLEKEVHELKSKP